MHRFQDKGLDIDVTMAIIRDKIRKELTRLLEGLCYEFLKEIIQTQRSQELMNRQKVRRLKKELKHHKTKEVSLSKAAKNSFMAIARQNTDEYHSVADLLREVEHSHLTEIKMETMVIKQFQTQPLAEPRTGCQTAAKGGPGGRKADFFVGEGDEEDEQTSSFDSSDLAQEAGAGDEAKPGLLGQRVKSTHQRMVTGLRKLIKLTDKDIIEQMRLEIDQLRSEAAGSQGQIERFKDQYLKAEEDRNFAQQALQEARMSFTKDLLSLQDQIR